MIEILLLQSGYYSHNEVITVLTLFTFWHVCEAPSVKLPEHTFPNKILPLLSISLWFICCLITYRWERPTHWWQGRRRWAGWAPPRCYCLGFHHPCRRCKQKSEVIELCIMHKSPLLPLTFPQMTKTLIFTLQQICKKGIRKLSFQCHVPLLVPWL